MIRGDKLRDKLLDYSDGTLFICVDHWDRPYYKVNGVYQVKHKRDESIPYGELVCVDSDHWKGHTGNGFSGTWKLLQPLDINLEDYM